MIEEPHVTPFAWLQSWAFAMQWPVVVVAAFWLGRYVQKLELRVAKNEAQLTALVERHMPQIHRMLAEIRGLLTGGR